MLLQECWQEVNPNSCQTALRTRPKFVLSTCCLVAVTSYTCRSQHHGHCGHCGHRGLRSLCGHCSPCAHSSHRSPLSGSVWHFIRTRHLSPSHRGIVVLSPLSVFMPDMFATHPGPSGIARLKVPDMTVIAWWLSKMLSGFWTGPGS